MRAAAHAMLICAGTIFAQNAAEPAKIANLVKLLDPQPKEQPLQCTVKILKPLLNFAFQFESGYSFQVLLSQYSRSDHTWTVLTEVTPQEVNAPPVYFLDTVLLGELVETDLSTVGATGGYRIGEGRYSVRWLLLDDLGRACRRSWQIQADRKGKFVSMEPHTVAEQFSIEISAHPSPGSGKPMRVTVLLDAAPLRVQPESPSRLHSWERLILLEGLVGLMERLPSSFVRLIVFNLEQQEELLRREDFTLGELDSVALALKDLQLGSVQRGVVEKPKGYVDLIASMLNGEIRSPSPSDAVVFLGPQERYFDKIPDGALDTPRGKKPSFFSVQFIPPPRWVVELSPTALEGFPGYGHSGRTIPITTGDFDTISKLIRRLKGKAVQVRTPDEFEKAIEDIKTSRSSGQGR